MRAIEASGVTKHYVRKHLLKNEVLRGVEQLDLRVEKGECFGLLGLNGAGKTTTMKLLMGLLFPEQGTVRVLDQDIQNVRVRQRIGYLPELPYLPLEFTVEEVLRYYASLFGITGAHREDRIRELLALVRLTTRKKKLRDFSKGMLQRVALAQALINDPEVLFLDEPMSGLDPLGYKDMRDILQTIKSQGRTLFLNSHLLSEVEKLCDRVGVMAQGRLADEARVEQVMQRHGSLERYFVGVIEHHGRGEWV